MSFAAVGSVLSEASSFSWTPGAIGHFILVQAENSSTSVIPSGISSSNATWAQLGTTQTGSVNARSAAVYIGTATSTATATVTVSFSGTPGTSHVVGQEFSSTTGWALDTYGLLDQASGSAWISLTPAGAGDLYWGYAINNGSAGAGSTPGYTYNNNADGAANGMAYNPSCGTGATAPVWADSGEAFGIMVLIKPATPPAIMLEQLPPIFQQRIR